MDTCDFINSLAAEQKAELRKLLGEKASDAPPISTVEFDTWPNGNLKYIDEYQNDKLHGVTLGWRENGAKHWEDNYQNGQLHGVSLRWYESGVKRWETNYQNGQLHGAMLGWRENGDKEYEHNYQNGVEVK